LWSLKGSAQDKNWKDKQDERDFGHHGRIIASAGSSVGAVYDRAQFADSTQNVRS
jgi:hypothetical protein